MGIFPMRSPDPDLMLESPLIRFPPMPPRAEVRRSEVCMSTVSKSGPKKSRKTDPFRYGWRDIRVKLPDGTVTDDTVPLTEEDVLFPKFGDFIVQTTRHNSDVGYLKCVFEAQLTGDRTAVVISDCLIQWNLPGVRPLGPGRRGLRGREASQRVEDLQREGRGRHPGAGGRGDLAEHASERSGPEGQVLSSGQGALST